MVVERDQIKVFQLNRKRTYITKRQKQILADLKKHCNELSCQELHRQLQKEQNGMGLTTVYRNLQMLIKRGLVRSRYLPTGEVLYAPVERDIHHLTCVNCGTTTTLNDCQIKGINLPKAKTKNFEFLFHTLEFFNLCQTCLKKQKT